MLNVLGFLDSPGAVLFGASLFGESGKKETSVKTRRRVPERLFLVVLKRVSGIVQQCEAL